MPYAVVRHLKWKHVDGTFFRDLHEAVAAFRSGSYTTSQMLVGPLGEEIEYWGLRQGRDAELHEWWAEHHRDHLDLELNVTSEAGTSWTIRGDRLWLVQEAKCMIEEVSGLGAHEQRLLLNGSVLHNSETLGERCERDAAISVTLMQRHHLHAAWLQTVQAEPAKLARAPAGIRADAEIVMAAALQDGSLQLLAAPSLLADKQYVLDAIRQRGGPRAPQLVKAPLAWVRTAADAKLALRAAHHLGSADLAATVTAKVLWGGVLLHASEEELVHLAVEPVLVPEVALALLSGLPKAFVRMAMQRSTLGNLPLGLQLLELEASAPAGGCVELKAPVLAGEVLSPEGYATSLFLRHAARLQGEGGAAPLASLLQYGLAPSGHETCRLLVRTCLAHGMLRHAAEAFTAGADDSEECAALLTGTGLPLSVLEGHRLRGSLLARVLSSYGGPAEVLRAVAEDRDSLQSLLHKARDDAAITRHPALCEALRLAAKEHREAAGRILLRAFATAAPQTLPDTELPLPWLKELHGIAGCDSLVIEKLLEDLEGTREEEQARFVADCWSFANWSACTPEQIARALNALKGISSRSRLSSARTGGHEGEVQRSKAERIVCKALDALPLALVESADALCDPALLPEAVTLFAYKKAYRANRQSLRATCRVEQVGRRLNREEVENQRRGLSLQHLQREGSSLKMNFAALGITFF